jgi:hypothetical protein
MNPKNRLYIVVAAVLVSAIGRADFVSVCDRSAPVRDFIVKTVSAGGTGQHDLKACADINEDDLAKLKRVAVPNRKMTTLQAGDFQNLPNLEILNVTGNPITELPYGVFDNLPKLKTLVMFRTKLTQLPDDFLEGMDDLENLHIFANPFTTIPEPVLQRLAAMTHLRVLDFSGALTKETKDRLIQIFPPSTHVELNFY